VVDVNSEKNSIEEIKEGAGGKIGKSLFNFRIQRKPEEASEEEKNSNWMTNTMDKEADNTIEVSNRSINEGIALLAKTEQRKLVPNVKIKTLAIGEETRFHMSPDPI
jgi:hypothetical protein